MKRSKKKTPKKDKDFGKGNDEKEKAFEVESVMWMDIEVSISPPSCCGAKRRKISKRKGEKERRKEKGRDDAGEGKLGGGGEAKQGPKTLMAKMHNPYPL